MGEENRLQKGEELPLLKLDEVVSRYDEKKIAQLVYQSHYYNYIKNLVNTIIISTSGKAKKEEESEQKEEDEESKGKENRIDKIKEVVVEVYGEEQADKKLLQVQEDLEKVQKTIVKNEFVEEIKSIVHLTFTKKSEGGDLDDIIDSFVRSIIKNRCIDIIQHDRLLKTFLEKAEETIKFVKPQDAPDTKKPFLDEMLERREMIKIIRRNILKLQDSDEKIVWLLGLLDWDPLDIAEAWPTETTNTEIQKIKQSAKRHLIELLLKDPQFCELSDIGGLY